MRYRMCQIKTAADSFSDIVLINEQSKGTVQDIVHLEKKKQPNSRAIKETLSYLWNTSKKLVASVFDVEQNRPSESFQAGFSLFGYVLNEDL